MKYHLTVAQIVNHNQDNEKRYMCYDTREHNEPLETYTSKPFRELQREFGRCISKIYCDRIDNPNLDYEFLGLERTYTTHEIGYVFQKKRKYEDCDEYYIEENWIELV